jgi:L-ascorbate metabolism protein UlaG (beta-lactamase superfamily)
MSAELMLSPAGAPNFETGSIFFVGIATVILRYAGSTILTDPNFLYAGDHGHLHGLISKRLINPAIAIDALPPIDFVLLSRKYEDQFDRLVEEKLDKMMLIVTMPHAANSLQKKGFQSLVAIKAAVAVVGLSDRADYLDCGETYTFTRSPAQR